MTHATVIVYEEEEESRILGERLLKAISLNPRKTQLDNLMVTRGGKGEVASFNTFLFVSTCGATKTMRQRQDNVICFSVLAIATRFFAAFPVARALLIGNDKYRNQLSLQ